MDNTRYPKFWVPYGIPFSNITNTQRRFIHLRYRKTREKFKAVYQVQMGQTLNEFMQDMIRMYTNWLQSWPFNYLSPRFSEVYSSH